MIVPIILTGPAGSGKSYWIQKYAKEINKQLFVCPCRKDRTLRDGRQKLHIWARRIEPAILWLEGADDLTPEAQAFLRRILETHANDVQFILECRDAGKLQEPIRSRCNIKRFFKPSWDNLEQYAISKLRSSHFKEQINIIEEINNIKLLLDINEYSYRRINQSINLISNFPDIWKNMLIHRKDELSVLYNQNENDIIDYTKKAYSPNILLIPHLKNNILKDYGICVEACGSTWAFLASALNKPMSSPHNE